ncbi:probable flavin-containing monooxygenase 1 [Coffea arabica]|uniref:Flavin-containing monooxygenase n=1 Tax=Coffea arabica TaxID=13443 RepID=A0ABM4VWX7_COFAR
MAMGIHMPKSRAPNQENRTIAIIGAGVSGLLACKYALQKGFSPTVFEARSSIGGVWSRTCDSTKLQTPKNHYRFSDFAWSDSVKEAFPDHNQVREYIYSYALHFNILPHIKFNCKVVSIDYLCTSSEEHMSSWELWAGIGEAFSPKGKWHVSVQDLQTSTDTNQVYQFDFVILCLGKFSGLANIPQFAMNKGPEVFDGEVMHSMDYAAMDNAAEFIKNKRVTIVGFQKSAIDIGAEIAKVNGAKHPCTLLFRTAHWSVPENLVEFIFRNLNRVSELTVHKPDEAFFLWLLAALLSPLLWIYSKVIENYLKWLYPLAKYDIIPEHGFLGQIRSCMLTVLPADFYEIVREGCLILKKAQTFSFCQTGVVVGDEDVPLETDIVIFATGYKSDQKFASVFKSIDFQKYLLGSSAPFYRECIHPKIPQLAIVGYSESHATIYTTEIRAKWLAHFLEGNFRLPTIREMEHNVMRWEKCMRRYTDPNFKRGCVSVMLQIYCNDEICRDMNCNPRRKKSILSELFAPHGPSDYADLSSLGREE